MKFANTAFAAVLAVIATGALARGEAAPLPTSVAAMNTALDTSVMQVRYGRWRGGWGYRGWGHPGWALGAATASAIVGCAIASSAYYGGTYPYYDAGFAYNGYASDYCPPSDYRSYYPGYGARPYCYGW